MELCGERVKHKVFGTGIIIAFANNRVKVLFDDSNEEKEFLYPSVFGRFLKIENKSILSEIQKDKNIIAEEEAEKRRIKEEQEEQEKLKQESNAKKSKKSSKKEENKSNIAFKCNYCDGGRSEKNIGYSGVCSEEIIEYNVSKAKHIWCKDPESLCYQYRKGDITKKELLDFCEENGFVCYESQMLKNWRAYAGVTQSGVNKGKPMKLKNVRINSLAMLTTRLPKAKDKDRFIFALFLVGENYEGDIRNEGYVEADAKYRIQLSLEEAQKLKFWDYYFNPNKPERIVLGSGLHRYLTNIQSAQILKKLCEIKRGTSDEVLASEFLEYYCEINKVDINNIPSPNGALQRDTLDKGDN
ncbi:hypothetical protein [Clostridium sp. DL1XJH146]